MSDYELQRLRQGAYRGVPGAFEAMTHASIRCGFALEVLTAPSRLSELFDKELLSLRLLALWQDFIGEQFGKTDQSMMDLFASMTAEEKGFFPTGRIVTMTTPNASGLDWIDHIMPYPVKVPTPQEWHSPPRPGRSNPEPWKPKEKWRRR